MIETTYHIEIQKIARGWIARIEILVWRDGASQTIHAEDVDGAFSSAAEAAAHAERRIQQIIR